MIIFTIHPSKPIRVTNPPSPPFTVPRFVLSCSVASLALAEALTCAIYQPERKTKITHAFVGNPESGDIAANVWAGMGGVDKYWVRRFESGRAGWSGGVGLRVGLGGEAHGYLCSGFYHPPNFRSAWF